MAKKDRSSTSRKFLLDDTILNNIAFLNDEKKIDMKKLQDAIYYSGTSR